MALTQSLQRCPTSADSLSTTNFSSKPSSECRWPPSQVQDNQEDDTFSSQTSTL